MERDAPIFAAGHRGLVGSAIVRALRAAGHATLLLRTSAELDLRDAAAADRFFAEHRPRHVFLAAAKVGGIVANHRFPVEFLADNLAIQGNVIAAAHRHGVERLLFLGSSCIYPKHAPQPLREDALLTGPLEPTNRAYAIAKIAGIELIWSHNRQHGTRFAATSLSARRARMIPTSGVSARWPTVSRRANHSLARVWKPPGVAADMGGTSARRASRTSGGKGDGVGTASMAATARSPPR